MGRSNQWYGWVPDVPDHRDLVYSAPTYARLPAKVDLRKALSSSTFLSHLQPFTVPCYDQGPIGSCTGNAVAAAVQFARIQASKTPEFTPSRLFLYYGGREAIQTVDEDSGAMIRDVIKFAKSTGVAPEAFTPPSPSQSPIWPYDVNRFAERPPQASYTFGLQHQVLSYRRVIQTTQQMRTCLAHGNPFVFGFAVYQGFESPVVEKTGVVNMPLSTEEFLGGHAVLAMGYDDEKQRFLVRNSWGEDWGDHGYFTMPYAYLVDRDLSDDFWMVRMVEA